MNSDLFSKLGLVLDHVAIAVSDLDQAQKVYEDIGFSFESEREVVESEGVQTAFAQIDGHGHIELLTPVGEDGPIHKYLEKKGEGIHHICFRVKDVKAKCEELAAKGYRLIHPEPKLGAKGCLVNFIHPKSTGGVLIEISQQGAQA